MDVTQTTQALAERMSRQLRVKGDGLAEVTAHAGRKLPRRLRADAETLVRAQAMAQNPKLARLLDERQLRKAERRLSRYLDRQNPSAERRGQILDVVAKIAFVIFTIALIVFFTLLNRGYFE